MRHINIQKNMGNIGRILLLSVASIGISIMLLWNTEPEWVTNLDKRIVKTYVKQYESKLQQVEKALESDDKIIGIQMLKQFLTDVADIKKNDRLDPLKRRGFTLLTSVLTETNNFEQALYWYDQWIEFDAKDIDAQVDKAYLMSRIPEYSEKGVQMLKDLYQNFPFDHVVDRYASMKESQGFDTQARAIRMANYYQNWIEQTDAMWEIFWDTGHGYNIFHKKAVYPLWKGRNAICISLKIQQGIKRIRIDLAPHGQIAVADAVLTIKNINIENKLFIKDSELKFNHMARKGPCVLVATGESDPYLDWPVTSSIPIEEPVQVIFQTEVFPSIFYTEKIKNLSDAESIADTMRSIGKEDIAELFLQSWKDWEAFPLKQTNAIVSED